MSLFNKKNLIALSFLILIGSLLAALLMHAYLGYFSRYLADDYCVAGAVKEYGFTQAIVNRYYSWDGRYAFSIITSAISLLGDKTASSLPVITLGLFLSAAYFFFQQLGKKIFANTSKLVLLLLSVMYVYVLFYAVPNIAQNYYWRNGITTYVLPIIFELFMIGLAIKLSSTADQHSQRQKILISILFVLLSFINSGFSEVSTALHVTILAVILLFQLTKRKQLNKSKTSLLYWSLLLVGALVGFVLMLSAPGNAFREELCPAHPGIVELAVQSAIISGKYIANWFATYAQTIIPSSFILILFGMLVPSIQILEKKNNLKIVLGTVFFSLLLVYASFVPSYWALSSVPPDRVWILPASALSMLVVLLSFFLGVLVKQQFNVYAKKPVVVGLIFVLICAVYSVYSPLIQARHFYYSNIYGARDFAEKWDEQNEIILQAVSQGEKRIEAPMIPTNILGVEHMQSFPEHWINYCVAEYYQVDQIIAIP